MSHHHQRDIDRCYRIGYLNFQCRLFSFIFLLQIFFFCIVVYSFLVSFFFTLHIRSISASSSSSSSTFSHPIRNQHFHLVFEGSISIIYSLICVHVHYIYNITIGWVGYPESDVWRIVPIVLLYGIWDAAAILLVYFLYTLLWAQN